MNRPVFPVYHFLVSAAILVFVVIFWRTHHRDHRNWLALRLFVLCSVNRWPLRMVKGTVVGTTDTLREMQRYEQLSSTGLTTGKSSREHRYMILQSVKKGLPPWDFTRSTTAPAPGAHRDCRCRSRRP